MYIRHQVVVGFTSTIFTSLVFGAVSDVFPGDYFPPPADSVAIYAISRQGEGPYRQGKKLAEGEVTQESLALRTVWITKLGGMPFAPMLVLPWAQLKSNALLAPSFGADSSGLGDVRAGATLWPLADKENAHYLGLTAMMLLPTGSYDNKQLLNPGENRWRLVLGVGWQKEIATNLLTELSSEYVRYGENKDYPGNRRLEQEESYALTGYLRYRLTPTWHMHVGGQINRGGATSIQGIDQNNPANNHRATLGVTWNGQSGQQVIFRVGKDNHIDNGLATSHEIALRFMQNY